MRLETIGDHIHLTYPKHDAGRWVGIVLTPEEMDELIKEMIDASSQARANRLAGQLRQQKLDWEIELDDLKTELETARGAAQAISPSS